MSISNHPYVMTLEDNLRAANKRVAGVENILEETKARAIRLATKLDERDIVVSSQTRTIDETRKALVTALGERDAARRCGFEEVVSLNKRLTCVVSENNRIKQANLRGHSAITHAPERLSETMKVNACNEELIRKLRENVQSLGNQIKADDDGRSASIHSLRNSLEASQRTATALQNRVIELEKAARARPVADRDLQVFDSRNHQRLLGTLVEGKRIFEGRETTHSSYTFAVMSKVDAYAHAGYAPLPSDYSENRVCFELAGGAYRFAPIVVTSAPLDLLMRLPQFRLPEETAYDAEVRRRNSR